MKPDFTNLLDSLSNNDATFFIPPYQRNYEWTESTCGVFLQDVQRVAESNKSGVRAEHFFGSIVYVVEESGFGIPSKFILTDGQQRITTTMLFLMALRDEIADEKYKETIQKKYLQNENSINESEFKIKLKQVETDWEAYKLLALFEEVPENLKNSAVFRNYSFFRRELAEYDQIELIDLISIGLAKFQIITIKLEPLQNPWENPQEIFESMNSLGQPLSLADLIRNFLLMGKSSSEQIHLYNNYWLKLEKQLPGRISEFVRDWMQADQSKFIKVAKESNFKELYSNFKDIVKNREIESIFQEFAQFAKSYAQACGLIPTGNHKIDVLINDLNKTGMTTAYSLIAKVLDMRIRDVADDVQVMEVLRALRTYVLRRRILQLSAGENKLYPALCDQISNVFYQSDTFEATLSLLSNWEYALRLPNDAEVKARLQTMNFYNFGVGKASPKLILSLLEEVLTKSRPSWDDERLQLEHIMPQTLSQFWRDDLGIDADEIHDKYLNVLGNITLIRHNQELGNKPFKEKKTLYGSKSGLQISQNMILDRDLWNSDSIEIRSEYVIDLLLKNVVSLPIGLRKSNNWKQTKVVETQFNSHHVLASLAGETICYYKDPRISAVVIGESTVLFEGKEWKLSPLTRELRLRDGELNSSSAYQGAYYWTWDNIRLIDLTP